MEEYINLKIAKKYLAILAILPVLFYFWPSSLGGSADFISVYGQSMVPTMENGELAVLKQDTSYKISDIIAYHFSELGVNKVIIHRIIAERPDHSFVLKGDNNKSVDPEAVKPNQIIGKLFFHIPYVGYLPLLMKQPLVLIITMMGLALFAMLEKNAKNKKKKAETNEVGPAKAQVTKEPGPAAFTPDPIKKKEKTHKRTKQISLFVPALLLNMAYYALGQYSISHGIMPRDFFTAFLIGLVKDPYLAGTIVFSSWFSAILGSYILSKYSISVEYQNATKTASGIVQMNRERLIPFKKSAQLFWMIFTGLYGLYTFVLISNLR